MLRAAERSAALFAKPDSITVPLSVSTLMELASTSLLSTKRALTEVVIAASSIYAPALSWPRVTAQPEAVTIANTARNEVSLVRSCMVFSLG